MPTKTKTENKPTLVAFLLDRTGSMQDCKNETIMGFNAYVKKLRAEKNDSMRLTLTQFDTQSVDIIHDAVPLKSVNELNDETYQPRGATPLYDAIGKTIRETEQKAGKKFKVLFVTLTDGLENSSREWNSDSIKTLIKSKENKDHWTFAYIGVGLEGFTTTSAIASGTIGMSNVMRSSKKNTAKMYAKFAGATTMFACSTGNVSCSDKNVWGSPNATDDDEEQQPK